MTNVRLSLNLDYLRFSSKELSSILDVLTLKPMYNYNKAISYAINSDSFNNKQFISMCYFFLKEIKFFYVKHNI